jgi:hypothetical protein
MDPLFLLLKSSTSIIPEWFSSSYWSILTQNSYQPSTVHSICYKGNKSINWCVCARYADTELLFSWLFNDIVNIMSI